MRHAKSLSARTFYLGIAAITLSALSPSARASFHEWKITEVYSNASGSVQFVEMFDPAGGENFIHSAGATLSSGSHNFSFPTDLAGDTTNKHILLATAGFASLAGGVTPDFTLASNFFSTAGDTLNYAGLDSFTFGAGVLPTNGIASLNRSWGDTTSGSAATNSPTNFAGQTGAVPEPASAALMGITFVWMTGQRRRGSLSR